MNTTQPLVDRRKTFSMRMWLYISRPFQITKVLELLYMLDWILYAVLSYFPEQYTTGSLFKALRSLMPHEFVSFTITLIAIFHLYALTANVIWMRRAALLFNIGVLMYITSLSLLTEAFSASSGYLLILIGVSMFAFWRMVEVSE